MNIEVYRSSELLKAKYTKRWKGKDGNWKYEYSQISGRGKHRQSQMEGIFGGANAGKIAGGGGTMQLREGSGMHKELTSRETELTEKWVDQGMNLNSADKKELSAIKLKMKGMQKKSKITNPTKREVDQFHSVSGGDGLNRMGASLEGSAVDKMRQAASMMSGKNLPESTYADVPAPKKINAKERKKLNNAINAFVPGNYHDGIPIDKLQDAVNSEGMVLVQEDGTPWSGMFTGEEGEAFFEMGRLQDGRMVNGFPTYKPVDNSGLRMTWYKMSQGRYEIVKYIT